MKAMQEEIMALDKNNIWDLVDLPDNRKPIDNKWIFKKKFQADGIMEKYKARLITKGYS